jgi:hypothetical protein
MVVKLKTAAGEVYLNPQTISRVHLSPDHSMITVHFVIGTVFTSPSGTDQERTAAAAFLAELSKQGSGFLSCGRELLNLRSALWISIPDEGPVQIRWEDNRTHSLFDVDVERVRRTLTGDAEA